MNVRDICVVFPILRALPQLLRRWLIALLVIVSIFSTPALAHKGKKHTQGRQAQQTQPVSQSVATPLASSSTASSQDQQSHGMTDGMDMEADRSSMPFFQRLYDWMGRFHPLIVHFPIAFFPAALFTAIVGRRRPAFSAPVQFLVVVGGIFAPIAAVAGWLAGMTADPEPILAYHRWLGVGVGLGGVALGVWAWRRPWEDRRAGMILALTLMTIAIAVQGFLGAGLTHGIDHLMF